MQIVIDISKERFKDIQRIASVQLDSNHFKTAEQIIANGTPQPKIGHWIADVDRWGDIVTTTDGYRCSECNTFDTDKDNYCPNCGAKMVEPQTLAYADQDTLMPAT